MASLPKGAFNSTPGPGTAMPGRITQKYAGLQQKIRPFLPRISGKNSRIFYPDKQPQTQA
jgi:hypothetical protein